MGKARIEEHIAESLYVITPLYDLTRIQDELDAMAEGDEQALLFEAMRSLVTLHRERDALRDSMLQLIDLWRSGLEPADIPPVDPVTPGPEAYEGERVSDDLFDAINAARTAAGVPALTREDALDNATRWHLWDLRVQSRMRINTPTSTPLTRALAAGFAAEDADMLLAGNRTDVDAVVEYWGDDILSTEWTHCGVAYAHGGRGNLWGVTLATAGAQPAARPANDPARESADDTGDELDGIKPPESDTPAEIASVATELAVAGQRVRAAEIEIARLREQIRQRDERRAKLQALLDAQTETVFAWAARWNTTLQPGAVVDTVEVPGFYTQSPRSTRTRMGVRNDRSNIIPDYWVDYDERDINIVPEWDNDTESRLQKTDAMTDAAVFFNAAVEPGVLRWRPRFRYAELLSIAPSGDPVLCDVRLLTRLARPLPGEAALFANPESDADRTLSDVIMSHVCARDVFEVGHEVLVMWLMHLGDWTPTVVGWRREPLPCPGSRSSWRQL